MITEEEKEQGQEVCNLEIKNKFNIKNVPVFSLCVRC